MISVRHFLTGALCAGYLAAQAFAGAAEPSPAMVREMLHRLPLRFQPNQGQWNPRVRFAARTGEYTLSLEDRQAVLSVPGARDVSISLLNANPHPVIEGAAELSSRANYFLGPRPESWRTGVREFQRVRYGNAWPGVDLVYYGNRGQLEYDFVLQPGADAGRIRLRFRGSKRLALTPEGDLAVETSAGRLIQRKPMVYQQDKQVAGRYRLLGRDTVGIELGGYDRSRSLTIDPVLEYSTLLGGTGSDAVTAVAVDQAGMIYATGYITSTGLEASGNAMQAGLAGGVDAFLAKFDPTRVGSDNLVYFTFIGGTGADIATAIALDRNFIYLAGATTSPDFPLANAQQTGLAASDTSDAFVLKLANNLDGSNSLFYSSFLGGAKADQATGIAVDAAGLIYVTGITQSSDFPMADPYRNFLWGLQDAFLTKIDPAAASPIVYSTYYGGESADDARGIAVNGNGSKVYLVGSTSSTLLPWNGNPYSTTLGGGSDAYIAQFDLTQPGSVSLTYATYVGGTDLEEGRGIAVDAGGQVLVTGYTLSTDFPVTGNALQSAQAGQGDIFIARFDTSRPGRAGLIYGTYFGGSGADSAHSIAVDAAGFVYLTGYTMSNDFPVTPDALSASYSNGIEVFLTRLDLTKTGAAALAYSTYMGAIGIHGGDSVAVGSDGTICVGGLTGPAPVQVTPNASQHQPAGGLSDGFVVILTPR